MILEIIIIVIAYLLNCVLFGGFSKNIVWYIDVPALICILALTCPVLLYKENWKDFFRAIKMLNKKYQCSLGEMKRALNVVEYMQKQLLCAGIITTLFPFIYILGKLTDLAELGPNVAVAILSVLYTIMLELLLLPIQLEVKKRILSYMEEE